VGLTFLIGCGEEHKPEENEIEWNKEISSEYSNAIAEDEEVDIQVFLEMRPEWKMKRTGSGLRYWVYESGDGEMPKSGEVADVEIQISLLNGTRCYGTEEDEYIEVAVDKSQAETGVQEALKLLRVGDKAKLIIPSHIGHGLLGDLDKIPPMHTLVMDIHLLGIKK